MGKWEKDVRALDRLIKQGKVIEKDWKWMEYNDYVMDSVTQLNEKIKQLTQKLAEVNEDSEAQANAEYYEKKYNEAVEANQQMIRNMYRYVTKRWVKAEWEDFRDFAINWEDSFNY